MSIVGDPSSWRSAFPDALIPAILDMICEVWARFVKPSPHDKETPTTLRFCAQLQQSPELQSLPLRVDPEVTLLNPSGEIIGRLDLRFTSQSVSDKEYFSFECKRLYPRKGTRTKSLADKYVGDGMMRYVTGQYASHRSQGGMIAYVHTGTAARAVDAVRKNVERCCSVLGMTPPGKLNRSRYRPTDPAARETIHLRNGAKFLIHHLFLEC